VAGDGGLGRLTTRLGLGLVFGALTTISGTVMEGEDDDAGAAAGAFCWANAAGTMTIAVATASAAVSHSRRKLCRQKRPRRIGAAITPQFRTMKKYNDINYLDK
jgi:hypothetical protein